MRDRSFLWTRRLPTAQLLAALPPGLRVARAERLEDRRSVLDTLDRRLSRAGLELALVSAPEGLSLELRDAEGPTLEVPAERAPAWAAELPAELHARVADLLEHRRLLPLWQLAERGTRYRVLDAQDKTVARLALVGREAVALPPPGSAAAPSLRATKLPRRLSLAPLRGYEGEAEEVAKALEEALGSAAESFQDEAQELQVALGLPLAVPATRLVLELDPEEGAERAMRHLVAGLLGLLEAHREGARLGLDAEALHDFRVVLRRLRSTLRELARLAP
ncbi:MAG TPA: CHAD domain-containing protein, partial [Thermoanaerobaculia bacterium]|nr:CHAD domain-containing protein [Thermoanaerobaculia bacterium]